MAARLEDGSLRERTVGARGSPNRGADVSARRGGQLWRSEWSGGGTGGGGFGEYYWLVGRRAVESDLGGIFGCGRGGGEDFRAVGGGSLAHGRFLQVQSHVSVKRQAEARSICVSRVQDRTCVGCNATATGVL